MNIFSLIKSFFYQILSILFFIVFLFGALNVYFSDKSNYCVMTFMFEYPQFVRIAVPENGEYPQYGLYAYSEGRLTERVRKMWFDGVPVLFLPGNLGSHKQSRSLASVALRKALSNIHDFHFDYFTVDYNEELSGMYGGVLEKQTEFAAHCVSKILSLYKSNKYVKTVPTSVVLIGHSMGGIIAKRLLAYPRTLNTTIIAITLAAPLEAPLINVDTTMNNYYLQMDREWTRNVNEVQSKLLLSFGGGARDILVPSRLTSSKECDIGALTTSLPGAWVSPDHVSIVWCKQIVMAINRFLFSVVNIHTKQTVDDKQFLLSQAKVYFQANRSMTLDSDIIRPNATMNPDAFWYEDNRRIYQISRPEITKSTYLMVRLVSFPQNRFAAIEAVNLDDKDWLFGCKADDVYSSHRYCKKATSITELSRWTGSANNFGKRKLATIQLHKIMDLYPQWTHVVVKVSPTRKPITLNVDINDHASRQITVDLPYFFSFGKSVIIEKTEASSLYYELVLPGLDLVHHTYYLYVEPIQANENKQCHASAEMHVPWARNHEYYHYFTHLKRTPMKIRLFKNNPNVTYNLETTEHAKITLLLDPQCTYTVSIAPSLYNQLGQMVRHYYPALIPYAAAAALLAARANLLRLRAGGACVSLHRCLASREVQPYHVLVAARLAIAAIVSVPVLSVWMETAGAEGQLLRSLLCVPAYLAAVGAAHAVAACLLALMVFSSQLAHRLLFRLVWRGGGVLAERMSGALRRVPTVASSALVCGVPLSCGAAALAAGAAFYCFMLSKMYEEYLEDYFYKLMAKVASKICHLFKSKRVNNVTAIVPTEESGSVMAKPETETEKDDKETKDVITGDESKDKDEGINEDSQLLVPVVSDESNPVETEDKCAKGTDDTLNDDIDRLSGLNFHMMMFLLWIIVTALNVAALITWARNFKYSMTLKPDTSYYTGFLMSMCAGFVWQMEAPRKNLKYYDLLSQVLFVMAVLILVLGPLGMYYINYIVMLAFVLITVQQMFDQEDDTIVGNDVPKPQDASKEKENQSADKIPSPEQSGSANEDTRKEESAKESKQQKDSENDCECNENRIYNMFVNLKEKFSYTEES